MNAVESSRVVNVRLLCYIVDCALFDETMREGNAAVKVMYAEERK